MSRPRIRSVKPEAWQDEKVGGLSRDARLTMLVLVTMADDEGRLRAAPSMILGHGFPYDDDAPRKLAGWLDELEACGLILRYEDNGKPYVAFRHWKRHQRINRANASLLPAPPDHEVVTENAVKDHDSITEPSVSSGDEVTDDAHPHAQACVPILSLPAVGNNENAPSRPRARRVTFRRKPVPSEKVELAERALADYCEQTGQKVGAYTGLGDPSEDLTRIVGALLQWPERLGDADACHRLVASTLESNWFKGTASVGAVFGPGVIQQNFARLDAPPARSGQGSEPRLPDGRVDLDLLQRRSDERNAERARRDQEFMEQFEAGNGTA